MVKLNFELTLSFPWSSYPLGTYIYKRNVTFFLQFDFFFHYLGKPFKWLCHIFGFLEETYHSDEKNSKPISAVLSQPFYKWILFLPHNFTFENFAQEKCQKKNSKHAQKVVINGQTSEFSSLHIQISKLCPQSAKFCGIARR